MSIKYLALIPILLLAFAISKAQNQVGKNIADHLLIKSAEKDLHGDPEKEIVGSPYLNDAFVKGDVYTFNDKFIGVPMRYDIHNDYIEFTQNNVTYILDPEPRVKKVTLDNKILVVEKYEYKGKAQHGYLELLDSGKVMLFAKKTILYREWQAAKALESAPTPGKYTKTADVYFYKNEKGEVRKADNLKKMIESFPDKQDELTQFVKKEKISGKEEDDLIKLVEYYNSL